VTEIRFGWRGARARVLAAGLTIVLAPLPLAAAEADRPAPAITLKAAVEKAAATERLASSSDAAAQPAQPVGTPNLGSRGFFKTPLGMAVIAVVGAGTAYAVYSAQHDRIHSAAR
jgi:hypothetical protein